MSHLFSRVLETQAVQAIQFKFDRDGDRLLSKPVQFDQLLDALEDYLELDWIYEQHSTDGTNEAAFADADLVPEALVVSATSGLPHLQTLAGRGGLNALREELTRPEKANPPNLQSLTGALCGFAQPFQLKPMPMLLEKYLTM